MSNPPQKRTAFSGTPTNDAEGVLARGELYKGTASEVKSRSKNAKIKLP